MRTLTYIFILLGILTLVVFSFLSTKLNFDMDITVGVYIYAGIAAFCIMLILLKEVGYALMTTNQYILQGFHRSFFHLPIIEVIGETYANTLLFRFNDSCFYNSNFNNHINKLFGISYRLLPVITSTKCDKPLFTIGKYNIVLGHHWNSVRIGWRANNCVEYTYDIYTYEYRQGKRIYNKIDTIDGTEKQCLLTLSNKSNFIRLDYNFGEKYTRTSVIVLEKKINFIYLLYPYFGGKTTSPQLMKINFKLI